MPTGQHTDALLCDTVSKPVDDEQHLCAATREVIITFMTAGMLHPIVLSNALHPGIETSLHATKPWLS